MLRPIDKNKNLTLKTTKAILDDEILDLEFVMSRMRLTIYLLPHLEFVNNVFMFKPLGVLYKIHGRWVEEHKY